MRKEREREKERERFNEKMENTENSKKGRERQSLSDQAGDWLREKSQEMRERQQEKERRKEEERKKDKLSCIEA